MRDLIYQVGKLALGPNDVLVVKVHRHFQDGGMIRAVKEHMKSFFGEDQRVLVVSSEIDFVVVSRPDTVGFDDEARAA